MSKLNIFEYMNVSSYLSSFVNESAVMKDLASHIEYHDEAIQINALQGQFLHWVVQITGASKILEVGTHHGYSTMWLGKSLDKDAQIDTFEVDYDRSKSAEKWIAKSGLKCKVSVFNSSILDSVEYLENDYYDLLFIDAEKKDYLSYLSALEGKLKVGGMLVADNTLHKGRVLDASPQKLGTRVIKQYNQVVFSDDRYCSVIVPIGDGLTLSQRIF